MTTRTTQFHKLLDSLRTATKNEEFKYIGTGNPLADILIVGKECGFDIKEPEQNGNDPEKYVRELEDYKKRLEQFEKEIIKNYEYWCGLKSFDPAHIPERKYEDYHALYPYRGQDLKRDNGLNNGTSVTWMNYQKLINLILGDTNNKKINFHEHAFITEVNSTPSEKTQDADTTSICFRKNHVLNSEFFRSFPIVIISGVGYFKVEKEDNEIERIFDVKFTEQKFASKKKQPYWIHWNADKTKLVINTYQLSIGVSDELLEAVAGENKHSGLLK